MPKKARKSTMHWTEEKLSEVLKLWKNKEPRDLAAELEVSHSSLIRIAKILRDKGFDIPKKKPKNKTDEVISQFERKYQKLKIR